MLLACPPHSPRLSRTVPLLLRAAAAAAAAATGALEAVPTPANDSRIPTSRGGSDVGSSCNGTGSSSGGMSGGGAGSGGAGGGGGGGSRAWLPDRHFDVLVVGLGAYGSSVMYHLARQGIKVAGIERFAAGHQHGSSHGASRIIRRAYFEGGQYSPLLERSYRLWHELQEEVRDGGLPVQQSPAPLFLRTGMLDIGGVFGRALASARSQGLQHEVLTAAELGRRHPAYRLPAHWRALYQPDGGMLHPERIVQAHVALAQRQGATLLAGRRVVRWRAGAGGTDGGVTVATDDGSTYSAAAAVLAPGPWIGALVPELAGLCVPERQVVGWFDIQAAARRHFAPSAFPVFVIQEEEGDGSPDAGAGGLGGGRAYYGFPEHGERPGFKIGLYNHLRQAAAHPSALEPAAAAAPNPADEAALRMGVRAYFPAAADGRLLAASACWFTNTPDGHFLIDRHPRHPQVVLVSACSGHGFKMAAGIGQLVARLAAGGAGKAGAGGAGGASGGGGGGSSGDDGGWRELLPFGFDPARPGHAEALARFGAAA